MSTYLDSPKKPMHYMHTITGRNFPFNAPSAEDIDIKDIAHALAMQCRFNGHVHEFYSVAQHCCLCCRYSEPEYKLWALLHDSAEAYITDMIRPQKEFMPVFKEWEHAIMLAVTERFGLKMPMPDEVKEIDNRLLASERDQLLNVGDDSIPWRSWRGVQPLDIVIHPWPWSSAKELFLQFYHLYKDNP